MGADQIKRAIPGTAYITIDYVRLTEVEYPNGRDLAYGYGTADAIDDILSRVKSISTSTDTHATYSYLGAGTIVTKEYDQDEPDVKLDYTGSGNSYSGFDRFGRVVDHIWSDDAGALDQYLYGYDRVGNRTSGDAIHNY